MPRFGQVFIFGLDTSVRALNGHPAYVCDPIRRKIRVCGMGCGKRTPESIHEGLLGQVVTTSFRSEETGLDMPRGIMLAFPADVRKALIAAGKDQAVADLYRLCTSDDLIGFELAICCVLDNGIQSAA